MINQEIIQKAFLKATKNGFFVGAQQCYPVITKEGKFKTYTIGSSKFFMDAPPYYLMIIFRHDFAKAFWGERVVIRGFNADTNNIAWKWHLQQMVLEKDPIKYLDKFL